MDTEEIIRLWHDVLELGRDRLRDAGLRRQALRQFFAAVVAPEGEMDAQLTELQTTLEQLRN